MHCERCHKRIYEVIETYKQLTGRCTCLWGKGYTRVKRGSQADWFIGNMRVTNFGSRMFHYW